MSAISHSSYSHSAYSNLPGTQTSGKTCSEPMQSVSGTASSSLSDDCFMPGTEGQFLDTYTRYHLSGGGVFRYGSDAGQRFEPTYIALTLVGTPGGSGGAGKAQQESRHVTLSEIDSSRPGAVYSNGDWISVEDFLDTHSSVPSESIPTDDAPVDNTIQLDSDRSRRMVSSGEIVREVVEFKTPDRNGITAMLK